MSNRRLVYYDLQAENSRWLFKPPLAGGIIIAAVYDVAYCGSPTTGHTPYSTLGVFHVMRYINVRYLLTYLHKEYITSVFSPTTGHTAFSLARKKYITSVFFISLS